MTAIIGHCLTDGFFLAADSRRTDLTTGRTWPSPVQKIYPLTQRTMICTGGLGTIGHLARERVHQMINGSALTLRQILDAAKHAFRSSYLASLKTHPNHSVPLYVIIAGQHPESGHGFLCAMKSNDDFNEFWIREPNRPYFTGSNTALVQDTASEVYFSLTRLSHRLRLDTYGIEAIRRISQRDPQVSLPAQLSLATNQMVNLFPVSSELPQPDPRFLIDV